MFKSRRVHMIVRLTMKTSPARRAFKEMLGQNNHFLITIMVGLDAVACGDAQLGAEFSTRWAPRDPIQSAQRSREFACKALTAWLVDALSAYVRSLCATPTIANSELVDKIKAADSLDAKIQTLTQDCGQGSSTATFLARVAVTWRNRLVHSQPRDKIDRALSAPLLERSMEIASTYQGLDVGRLLDSIKNNHSPTFKETTALVRSAHVFVEIVDSLLLQRTDLDHYVRQILIEYVSEDPVQRTSNVWGKDSRRRVTSLMQICRQYGMTDDQTASNHVSDHTIEEIISWTPAQAKAVLCPGA